VQVDNADKRAYNENRTKLPHLLLAPRRQISVYASDWKCVRISLLLNFAFYRHNYLPLDFKNWQTLLVLVFNYSRVLNIEMGGDDELD